MTLTEELNSMETSNTNRREASSALQSDWGAVRIGFDGWPGTTVAVKKDKKEVMADAVGAKKISASVPKFDTKHPTYKALTACKTKIKDTWECRTLDWVEDGVRLIRLDKIEEFNATMAELRAELETARNAFAEVYPDLIDQAREDNGELFDRSAYLEDFEGQYTFTVDYPSLTMPAWLQKLANVNPTLYAEQTARIKARFDQAVSMAEDAFIGELAKLVEDLQRKLSGLDDGTEKKLMGSTVENLREFFGRFKSLNLHSSPELDRLVEQAELALSGQDLIGGKPVTRDELKDSENIRRDVRSRLSVVASQLEGMMAASPRRAINRRRKAEDVKQD